MLEQAYIEWIREGLKAPGKTQAGLAQALGIAQPQVSRLLAGGRRLFVGEIEKIARYLGSPPPAEVTISIPGEMKYAPVAGTAEAGTFREVDDMDQSEPRLYSVAPDPDFPNARQFFVTVAGDSMNALRPRAILPGDRALCVAWEDINVTPRDGMTVVVERTRDGGHFREWSIKQIELYEDRVELHPRSSNARHKPIVIERDAEADDGTSVHIIGLVRSVHNDIPLS